MFLWTVLFFCFVVSALQLQRQGTWHELNHVHGGYLQGICWRMPLCIQCSLFSVQLAPAHIDNLLLQLYGTPVGISHLMAYRRPRDLPLSKDNMYSMELATKVEQVVEQVVPRCSLSH